MIRELFKLGASKDIISFGGGNPSAETFPCKEIEEIAAKGLGENPVSLLQYGLSEGYTPDKRLEISYSIYISSFKYLLMQKRARIP